MIHAFQVGEASVSIYPIGPDGAPITANPVWLGAAAEGIRLQQEIEEIEDQPSGALYPETHHGPERHFIEIEKLWEVDVPVIAQPTNLTVTLISDGPPTNNGKEHRIVRGQEYVMTIVWEDFYEPDRWHTRTYYGVTDRSMEVGAAASDDAFRSRLSLKAKYFLT